MKRTLVPISIFIMLFVVIGIAFFNNLSITSSKEPVKNQNLIEDRLNNAISEKHKKTLSRERMGSVEQITYQTTFEKREYEKKALVYLPTEYKKTKNKKRYDVLYLMHGWNMGPEDFLGDVDKNQPILWRSMIDNLIDSGKIDPVIVVAPSYYPDRSMITENWNDDIPLNERFAKTELITDLMPLIANRYHTYAKNGNPNELKRARNHHAFGGFSMGSATSWFVFQHDLEYFRYFMPMAGPNYSDSSVMNHAVEKLGLDTQDFLISASVGESDGTKTSMERTIAELNDEASFNNTNLKYFVSKGGHDEESFVDQSFRSLQIFF
ncbi:alpha/beta hydrolase-fold protein [Enterococcus thailandicus]|uniref:alpha/beta hydrolase n=1 Tax=Enterococcus thailandicus TaxID=417368 RepID=UPI0022EBB1F7|nr:alpha/beta hydrolase-fold protein [Enterococcus thailandicus]MDA3972754.1 alpha/beta hydrolase-fold protein [Enterococcus thailandicus]MDA3975250.1 alpha/beta hydrolase-fold protein [Enterococcus thailandicus]MDA3980214.1 alpha/beta hydrolase-fold protein [Enterococcus thailandicus]